MCPSGAVRARSMDRSWRSRSWTRSRERVVVYDGAFGTYIQSLDLQRRRLRRPRPRGLQRAPRADPARRHRRHARRLLPGRRRRRGDGHVRRRSPPCSPSTTSPTRPTSMNRARRPRSPARWRPVTRAGGHQRYVAGSMGPGTKLPSLGHIAFADLRDAYEEQARGLLDGGVDLLARSRPATTSCRPRRPWSPAAGPWPPSAAACRSRSQVTIETTGRMLVGSEIGAALTSLRR